MCAIAAHQDFDMNGELKMGVIVLLEEVLRDPDLLPQERKATTNILRCAKKIETHVRKQIYIRHFSH